MSWKMKVRTLIDPPLVRSLARRRPPHHVSEQPAICEVAGTVCDCVPCLLLDQPDPCAACLAA